MMSSSFADEKASVQTIPLSGGAGSIRPSKASGEQLQSRHDEFPLSKAQDRLRKSLKELPFEPPETDDDLDIITRIIMGLYDAPPEWISAKWYPDFKAKVRSEILEDPHGEICNWANALSNGSRYGQFSTAVSRQSMTNIMRRLPSLISQAAYRFRQDNSTDSKHESFPTHSYTSDLEFAGCKDRWQQMLTRLGPPLPSRIYEPEKPHFQLQFHPSPELSGNLETAEDILQALTYCLIDPPDSTSKSKLGQLCFQPNPNPAFWARSETPKDTAKLIKALSEATDSAGLISAAFPNVDLSKWSEEERKSFNEFAETYMSDKLSIGTLPGKFIHLVGTWDPDIAIDFGAVFRPIAKHLSTMPGEWVKSDMGESWNVFSKVSDIPPGKQHLVGLLDPIATKKAQASLVKMTNYLRVGDSIDLSTDGYELLREIHGKTWVYPGNGRINETHFDLLKSLFTKGVEGPVSMIATYAPDIKEVKKEENVKEDAPSSSSTSNAAGKRRKGLRERLGLRNSKAD